MIKPTEMKKRLENKLLAYLAVAYAVYRPLGYMVELNANRPAQGNTYGRQSGSIELKLKQ